MGERRSQGATGDYYSLDRSAADGPTLGNDRGPGEGLSRKQDMESRLALHYRIDLRAQRRDIRRTQVSFKVVKTAPALVVDEGIGIALFSVQLIGEHTRRLHRSKGQRDEPD
jgi:hypothetical protein